MLLHEEPLRALWRINSDPRQTVLSTEFMALANHRKAVGAELKAYSERVRDIETAAATQVLRANGVNLDDYPPVAMSMIVAQVARSVGNEGAVGVTRGHEELRAFIDQQIDLLSKPTEVVRD